MKILKTRSLGVRVLVMVGAAALVTAVGVAVGQGAALQKHDGKGPQAAASKPAEPTTADAGAQGNTPPGGEDAKKDGGGGGGGGAPVAKVVLGDVRMEKVARWRAVTGTLRAWRRSRVAAEEPGRVVSVGFEEGDIVKDGTLLVQVDDTIQKLSVARDEAALEVGKRIAEEREAELQRSERELARMEGMSGVGGVSENDVDLRRTAVASWKSRLAQARGDLLTLENNLRESRRRLERLGVKAPFGGMVVSKRTEMGQWVNAGDSVAEIIDTTALEARLDVPEALIALLKEGQTKVRIAIPALGVDAEAAVYRIVQDADSMSRLVPVRVRLENKEGRLAPGMSISGLIPVGAEESALTVPMDAVLRDDAGTFVYFNAGGAAMPLRVRVRYNSGDRAVIEPGGLAPGMRVIIEGNERIFFPGQPIAELPGSGVEGAANSASQGTDGSAAKPAPKGDSRKPE